MIRQFLREQNYNGEGRERKGERGREREEGREREGGVRGEGIADEGFAG
jgi:hypothetical protein